MTHCVMLTEYRVNLKEAESSDDADIPILFVNELHYFSLNKNNKVEF